jgi:hypothetical protein
MRARWQPPGCWWMASLRSSRFGEPVIPDGRRVTSPLCSGRVGGYERPSVLSKLPGNLISGPAPQGVAAMAGGLSPMPCSSTVERKTGTPQAMFGSISCTRTRNGFRLLLKVRRCVLRAARCAVGRSKAKTAGVRTVCAWKRRHSAKPVHFWCSKMLSRHPPAKRMLRLDAPWRSAR